MENSTFIRVCVTHCLRSLGLSPLGKTATLLAIFLSYICRTLIDWLIGHYPTVKEDFWKDWMLNFACHETMVMRYCTNILWCNIFISISIWHLDILCASKNWPVACLEICLPASYCQYIACDPCLLKTKLINFYRRPFALGTLHLSDRPSVVLCNTWHLSGCACVCYT